MTETVLKSIMRLCAIIANLGGTGDIKHAAPMVESYVRQLVSLSKVNQYLMMFEFYSKSLRRGEKLTEKQISLYSVKSLIICEQINEVLLYSDKLLIILLLLEIICNKDAFNELELEFIKTIAKSLNITDEDYYNTKAFITESLSNVPEKDRVLIIDSNEEPAIKGIKHIQNENLRGKIIVLNYKITNTFIFRHTEVDDQLMLNNRRILLNQSYIFTKGSSIRSPRLDPIYYSDIVSKFLQDETTFDFTFTAIDVEFRFPNSPNGIFPMCFTGQSGQLIGIMGGSGVGKSTLLNVLNGSLKPANGRILINGFDYHLEREKLEGVIGFIPQDDLLIEELSVFQNLYFNAKLCFKDFSEEEINRIVNKVLKDLGLFKIRDLIVGSPLKKFISGGQRKRLNIALELIREPFILLVDEPTSGLSSSDSEVVMDLFKEQALKGKLVVINIHQPSSEIFKLFDKLLILDEGGRPVYFGNPVDAIVYFKTERYLINATESECLSCGNLNPEQILHIIDAKDVDKEGHFTEHRKVGAQQWYELYKKNIESKIDLDEARKDAPTNQFEIPDRIKQFKIFSRRNLLSKLADKQYLLINLLEAPLLAIILGFFTKYISGTEQNPFKYVFSENENIPAFLFMSIIVALFLGLMVSAEEIIRDRKILKRESFLNLSWSSYLNAKILFLFALSALQSLSFVLLGNLILGIKGMVLYYWLILFSISCFANMLGLNLSASLKTVVSIYITIPLMLVPQLLFAGVIVKFDKLHRDVTNPRYVPFIGEIMASRWGYEALAVSQYKFNKYQVHFYDIEREESDAAFKMNYLIPDLLSRLSFCQRNISESSNRKKVQDNLDLIVNEIKKAQNSMVIPDFPYLPSLNVSSFNQEVYAKTDEFLNLLRRYYSKRLDQVILKKDKLTMKLIDKMDGKDNFLKFRSRYFNIQLADQLKNKFERQKIVQHRNELIRKAEPIYKYPDSRVGRAHFYAPRKRIANWYVETLWFNLFAIWLMSVILYLTLLFNAFQRFFLLFRRIKLTKLLNLINYLR